jgi:hypothetical protein
VFDRHSEAYYGLSKSTYIFMASIREAKGMMQDCYSYGDAGTRDEEYLALGLTVCLSCGE